MIAERQRLDIALTNMGLAASRSRARDMVQRGCVTVDGEVALKAGMLVAHGACITANDPSATYVSRAALKLIAGLDDARIDCAGRVAVDLGASTGGFTQVLLERGASDVFAIDVGHGQMDATLRTDLRVHCMEGVNARDLTMQYLPYAPNIVVSDLSFVSLRKAAAPALELAAPEADAVLLVKPQFEVGREHVGKGGIVADQAVIDAMLEGISTWFDALPHWRSTHLLPSPIKGGDGNREWLLCGKRDG
ncbi:MAG: TlyA family RNA methyltransferase [Ahrensia sp.]|nr:TlyA family RNA methyltransferase [Ahrensia sp.]